MWEERTIHIPAGGIELHGDLTIPDQPRGLILIAHGSGSSRRSPRNRQVAAMLREHRFATLLLDLISEEEKNDEAAAFDLEGLGARVSAVVRWLQAYPDTSGLPIGLFGASTGAAVAVIAASKSEKGQIRTVVSRGGRTDMAMDKLARLEVPILFIVGSEDDYVLDLNKASMAVVKGEKKLEIVEGASHLFEEPGALERVGELCIDWFEVHLNERG